jgi:AraC family transcriptional regulator
MREKDSPVTGSDPSASRLSLEKFRLRTASAFTVEVALARPGVQLAICRYRWDSALPLSEFRSDMHYLDFALIHRRSEFEVAYLGRAHRDVFAASGDCCFVPAGHEMLVRCPQGEQRALTCLLDPEVLKQYFDWEWTALELAHCVDIGDIHVRAGLSRIVEELSNPGFAADIVIDSTLSTLMVDLHRHFLGTRDTADLAGGKLSAHKLRFLAELIDTSPHPFPSVDWLASQCGFSARHLSRTFRHTTGRTLGGFVAEIRIARAKRRLAERHSLIKEIAHECGFQSQSAFAHAFRRATGLTPQQYRHRST